MLSGGHSSLFLLSLAGLSVGYEFGHWSLQDAKIIAEMIKKIGTLDYLNFEEMEDQCLHTTVMITPWQYVRQQIESTIFGVAVRDPFEIQATYGRQVKGSITDHSIELIVGEAGRTVQDLNFYYQSQITVAGLETILRGCHLLRNLIIIGKYFSTVLDLIEVGIEYLGVLNE